MFGMLQNSVTFAPWIYHNTRRGVYPVLNFYFMLHKSLFSTVAAIAAANPAGFTYNVQTGSFPSSGYVVACKETQNSFNAEGLQAVLQFISETPAVSCVGGWLDTESGLYYFDASYIVEDLETAKSLGIANGQIAIFNLNTLEEIRL